MKTQFLLVLALVIGSTSPAIVSASENVQEKQSTLQKEVDQLALSKELNRFEESIIDRKNDAIRQHITEKLANNTADKNDKALVMGQLHLMTTLLAVNEHDLAMLAKASKTAADEEKIDIQFAMQKRISAMDKYYSNLSQTLQWASQIGIDTTIEEKQLELDL
ncbi:mechanosensitive ion channel family protein, partial [Vibrio sp. S4B1]|nr:mechanosensitive ion channel family protein [Vibrio methylphosphonaticus]